MNWLNFFDKFAFWRKDRIKGDYILILDIGTEFVKSLIFKVNKMANTGSVVGYGYEQQTPGNMVAGAVANISGVIDICKEAIRKAKLSAGFKPSFPISQAILGIAGEFVRGAVTTSIYERENAKSRIDVAEFKNIIQKIQWRALQKIRQEVAEEMGISEIEIKLINAAIVSIKIDGYKVTNPLSFQGKQLSLSIFNAYAPLVHLGALQEITKNLGLEILFVAAEPYAIAKAIKDKENEADLDAIFIDIGGGTTDIAVVREGGIDGIKSLALGGKAFTKRLAQVFDLGIREAEEIKLKYSEGDLSTIVKRKINTIFVQDIKIWQDGVKLVLEEFSQNNYLPVQIWLCGGASLLPGVKKILEPAKVNFIRPEDIIGVKDETGELISPKDITPLSLAGLALDLMKEENHVIKSILRRTIRLIQS